MRIQNRWALQESGWICLKRMSGFFETQWQVDLLKDIGTSHKLLIPENDALDDFDSRIADMRSHRMPPV